MSDAAQEFGGAAGGGYGGPDGPERPRRGFADVVLTPGGEARPWQGDHLTRSVFASTARTRAWSRPARIGMGLVLILVALLVRLAARDALAPAPNLPVLIALVAGAVAFGRSAATIISVLWVLLLVPQVFGPGGPAISGPAEVLVLLVSLAATIAIGWLIASLAWALDHLERQEAELEASRDRLAGILDALPIGVSVRRATVDPAPVMNTAMGPLFGVTDPESAARVFGVWESYDRQGRRMLIEDYPFPRAMATGEPAQGEYRFRRGDGSLAWMRVISAPLRDRAGRLVAGVTAVVDIDRQMRVLEHQEWLVAELAHRTRNLMAVVQGLATATLARAPSLEAFKDTFLGRIQALATAHSLFLKAAEEGVDIGTLVHSVLAPFDQTARIGIEGPEVRIASRQGVALALILHELATNAAKHGALSRPEGRLRVAWAVRAAEPDAAQPSMRLSWAEAGLGEAPQMAREGFGLRLIRRSVENDLEGRLERRVGEEALAVVLRFPLVPDKLLMPQEAELASPLAGSNGAFVGKVSSGAG